MVYYYFYYYDLLYYIISLAPTPSFRRIVSLVGHWMTPFHPVFIFGTIATVWFVLSDGWFGIVVTVLLFSVVSTPLMMGAVGATRVTPIFPLFLFRSDNRVASGSSRSQRSLDCLSRGHSLGDHCCN